MKRSAQGFGLIEIMVALVLGLVISMGIIQIFSAARGTYVSQNAAARMQEDARFVLSKLVQELRMTGMYGCLSANSYALVAVAPEISRVATVALNTPILWDNTNQVLTIITADIGASGGVPTWTILSDCQSLSQLYSGSQAPASGQTAFPLRQLFYTLSNGTLYVKTSAAGAQQPLLQNVSKFEVSFGMAGNPMTYATSVSTAMAADIRSVRLKLILTDPSGRVADQSYSVVAHVRNRL